ncbi:MAG: hypothetical protein EI684_17025 [Candidatus Viridilinea halotolerans]|uniref:Uncharacterized protein n=1 Tax=Candidatus Viridilinea halotolerans TaxID=2491704 RepID=A0A426TUG2_9CHLR|nr:MAG: hypothetical protein EI684_17025 [Candidatus Viridilinea halotolerans]
MHGAEREVIEKFQQLDSDAQQRVRELIGPATPVTIPADAVEFDCAAWFSAVDSLRQEIHYAAAEWLKSHA